MEVLRDPVGVQANPKRGETVPLYTAEDPATTDCVPHSTNPLPKFNQVWPVAGKCSRWRQAALGWRNCIGWE